MITFLIDFMQWVYEHWFISFWVLWFMFIQLAPLKKKILSGPWYIKWPGSFLIIIFLIGDVVWNVIPGSVLFLELPSLKWLTLSQRLNNIIRTKPYGSWRHKLARFIGYKLINPFAPNHINT
jgi:hypothetical protein